MPRSAPSFGPRGALLVLIGATAGGCGIGDKIDLWIDEADKVTERVCECTWQLLEVPGESEGEGEDDTPGAYGSENACTDDRAIGDLRRDCIHRAFEDHDRELAEPALDCQLDAFDDYDACADARACEADHARHACLTTLERVIAECPPLPPEIQQNLTACTAS